MQCRKVNAETFADLAGIAKGAMKDMSLDHRRKDYRAYSCTLQKALHVIRIWD
jgi:hypothetical protein